MTNTIKPVLAPSYAVYRNYVARENLIPRDYPYISHPRMFRNLARGMTVIAIDGWRRGFSPSDAAEIDAQLRDRAAEIIFIGR